MTDFYAQLEHQLVDAGRRRAGQGSLRRAATGRARLVAAAGAAVLVLAAGGALVSGLRSGSGTTVPDRGAAPQPAPPAVPAPLGPQPLRGVGVAVFNGTFTSGLGRTVADLLETRGATILTISSASDQSATETIVSYTDGNEAPARRVAAVLGVDGVVPYKGTPPLPFHGDPVIVVAGRDRIAP